MRDSLSISIGGISLGKIDNVYRETIGADFYMQYSGVYRKFGYATQKVNRLGDYGIVEKNIKYSRATDFTKIWQYAFKFSINGVIIYKQMLTGKFFNRNNRYDALTFYKMDFNKILKKMQSKKLFFNICQWRVSPNSEGREIMRLYSYCNILDFSNIVDISTTCISTDIIFNCVYVASSYADRYDASPWTDLLST